VDILCIVVMANAAMTCAISAVDTEQSDINQLVFKHTHCAALPLEHVSLLQMPCPEQEGEAHVQSPAMRIFLVKFVLELFVYENAGTGVLG
jgi:hypothetical protein